MKIRKAVSDDSKWILHHRIEMFRDMGETEVQLREIASLVEEYLKSDWIEDYHYFLVEEEDRVIGGCGLSLFRIPPKSAQISGFYAYLSNMYVEPEFRRKGVGRLLMKHVIDYCKSKHIALIFLHASDKGLQLYNTLGFESSQKLMQLRTLDFDN